MKLDLEQLNRLSETVQSSIRNVISELQRLQESEQELHFIRATLMVNCRSDQPLASRGISYDQSKGVHDNLWSILHKLVGESKYEPIQDRAEELAEPIEGGVGLAKQTEAQGD